MASDSTAAERRAKERHSDPPELPSTARTTPNSSIFISYRREDQSAFAHRLHDELSAVFRYGAVFFDVASIELGLDFQLELERVLQQCKVVLVVIGQHWLTVVDAEGNRRLGDPYDFVRLEVEAALRREIRVIPVLVDGALMPRVDELPASIKQLSGRNAFYISNARFRTDCADLIGRLERILAPRPAARLHPPPVPLVKPSEKRPHVLPDDHLLWVAHNGLEGHRNLPDWDPDEDLDRAEAFYQPVTGKARVVLDLLIDHPGQQLSVDDIIARTGGTFSGSRSIAGAIAGLYRSHKMSERRYPFYWWEGQPSKYAMKLSVADLFRRARSNTSFSQPGTAPAVPPEAPSPIANAAATRSDNVRLIGDVELTAGNVKNSSIRISSIFDRFPADVKGGPNINSAAEKEISIDWGGKSVARTDIDSEKKIFRSRAWVSEFLRRYEGRAGDFVRIEETAPYQYRVSILKNR